MGFFTDVALPLIVGGALVGIPLVVVNHIILVWAKGVKHGALDGHKAWDGGPFRFHDAPKRGFKLAMYKRGFRHGSKRRSMENTKRRVKRKELA